VPVHFCSGGKDHKSKQGNRTLHALFYQLAIQQIQVAKESKNQEILYFMNTTNANERNAKQKDKRWFVS
jgi:transposase